MIRVFGRQEIFLVTGIAVLAKSGITCCSCKVTINTFGVSMALNQGEEIMVKTCSVPLK
jgi:hypothetical protein